MMTKLWTVVVLLLLLIKQVLLATSTFVPPTANKVESQSTTAIQMKQRELQAAAMASVIALTVATALPLPSTAEVAAASSPPRVVVTPFGGGFGGLGLSPFGLNPFGGLGGGFGFRITPPSSEPPQEQLQAMKEYRSRLDQEIKALEKQQQEIERISNQTPHEQK